MVLLIAFAVLSIVVSFICSILEATLLSITPSYIARQKLAHPHRHAQLKKLKDQIDQPLSAILTINTIAHTVGAAGVGAQVTVVFGDGYLGLASAVMTVLILLLSEIIPKTLGARYWPQIAIVMPPFLFGLIFVLKPFIWISDKITNLLSNKGEQQDMRTEIKALATFAHEIQSIDESERRSIINLLDLHTMRVQEILTPRIVSETLKPDMRLEDVKTRVLKSQFSRFPILDDDEAPHGVLFKGDLVATGDKEYAIEIARKAKVVANTISVEDLLSQLIEEQQHMCLVYDEYGTWQGIVTMEDIIETIIGRAILDETDQIPNMRRFARRRWMALNKNK